MSNINSAQNGGGTESSASAQLGVNSYREYYNGKTIYDQFHNETGDRKKPHLDHPESYV